MSSAPVADPPAPPSADPSPAVVDHVRAKLGGPSPVTLAELLKGLPRPKKPRGKKGQPPPPAPDPADEVARFLDGELRVGGVYRYPSGKGGVVRYWGQDEGHRVREAVLAAAAEPQAMSALKKATAQAAGTAPSPDFVEAVIRELIADDRLFEHPPKTKAGGPRLGTAAPPPPPGPLERPQFKKTVDALVKSAAKLLADAGVPFAEVVALLRTRLKVDEPAPPRPPATTGPEPAAEPPPPAREMPPAAATKDLERRIVARVREAGGMAFLAELRDEMNDSRFDAAVLQLSTDDAVFLVPHDQPNQLTAEDRGGLVSDGDTYFTQIGLREE